MEDEVEDMLASVSDESESLSSDSMFAADESSSTCCLSSVCAISRAKLVSKRERSRRKQVFTKLKFSL